MNPQTAYMTFSLAVLLSCKTSQNRNFIKSTGEKQVVLTGAPAPHVLFVLKRGDTLKFSSRDISSLLEERAKKQTTQQGFLSDQSWMDLSAALKNRSNDTLVVQKLSAVDTAVLSGILDTWVAKKLLLKGKAVVVLKGQTDHPTRLKYIHIKDVLGGQQGTFFTEDGKEVYFSILALGE